jgi:hypothetical protein
VPWTLCPCCASLRSTWADVGPGFPFQIACPSCGVASDVAAVPMRLLPPERLAQEQRTAALALRVHRAVAAMRLPLDRSN